MNELNALAIDVLETLAKEDETFYKARGFYTTKTKAGDCKVLQFSIPKEKDQYESWRENNEI